MYNNRTRRKVPTSSVSRRTDATHSRPLVGLRQRTSFGDSKSCSTFGSEDVLEMFTSQQTPMSSEGNQESTIRIEGIEGR